MADKELSENSFYVYALFDWRGWPFYIGKGKDYRAFQHKYMPTRGRNRYRTSIVIKTIKITGDCPTVIIRNNLSEQEAFETEIALIKAIGRRPNGPLVNMTDGGEGASGRPPLSKEVRERIARATSIRSKGRSPSEETKQKLAAALKGRKRPPEIGRKVAATRKANAKPLSEESLERIKKAAQNRPQSWRDNIAKSLKGKKHSKEHNAKIAASGVGRVTSDETKKKLSKIHKGRYISPEWRAKMRQSHARRKIREPEQKGQLRLDLD